MDTSKLKKFAQYARRSLIEQVESKLNLVLDSESEAHRESPGVVATLEKRLAEHGQEQLIEQVAYTWFNRFCALRFMDVNQYNRIMVISPLEGQFQPEILAESKAGHIDESTVGASAREKIFGLLGGSIASRDGQSEAFRMLVVAVCNNLHDSMPYMFERINDYTELLMPDDLLSDNSILAYTREAMTPEVCKSVESIGWLYQFYISEKKDEVFADLKKSQKITAEDIPSATQLFTPHWIVRYLVENSLGRLWLLNRPGSKLADRMEYYIAPEEVETDFVRIARPEDIRICDPAVGSGHMLTYAFDLLYEIYEEEGYESVEIPGHILSHNLTGLEIDDRAGALAAFALAMKAAAKLGRRRFLRMEVKPNIRVLQNVAFTEVEIQDVVAVIGKDLCTDELLETLGQFEEARNFGSLIVPKLRDPSGILRVVQALDFGGDLLRSHILERVVAVLRMTEVLSPKYHVVVANPPYMNASGANGTLKNLLNTSYKDFKSDLFAAFSKRCLSLLEESGVCGLMTPFVWMFIATHEKLRNLFYSENTLLGLVRPSYTAFFQSAIVPVCAFLVVRRREPHLPAHYLDLGYLGNANEQPERFILAKKGELNNGKFWRTSNEIQSIPNSPVAYWIGKGTIDAFSKLTKIHEDFPVKSGMMTGNDTAFLRLWHEVPLQKIAFGLSDHGEMSNKFYPMSKGGDFRKWYGNFSHVVNLENDAFAIKNSGLNYRLREKTLYFKPYVTWSRITSSNIGFRLVGGGVLFSDAAPGIFSGPETLSTLAAVNSNSAKHFLNALNPTLNFQTGDIERLPYLVAHADGIAEKLVSIGRNDWNAYESSWDFTALPLLSDSHRAETLKGSYAHLRSHWQDMTDEMQQLEEQNNSLFINAYGLKDELTPDVPLNEVTLTCNPAYRYGMKNNAEVNEIRLLADTMAEFLSYAVGCMFGRYSLDAPGLILASQGDGMAEFTAKVQKSTFEPDEDNVVPLIDFDGDWFEDDISERFKQFLKTTFGEVGFVENLAFIENSIGKDIKKYFLKDFYTDHIKRYKKRPIYWLFSSPKGSFNALIYVHRYSSDTTSVVLNDYLREFRTKLVARKDSYEQVEVSASASPKEKNQAIKAIQKINKVLDEVNDYERDILYPLASRNIEIDLDDGVKHNYPLFGKALKKTPGLS